MASILDTIPAEILEQIAFRTVQDTRLGPPSNLIPLLLVNQRLTSILSFHTTPHLYASIFAFKFDSDSAIRRLGANRTQSNHFAQELKRRFIVLQRIRRRQGCTLPPGEPSQSLEGLEVQYETLYTAYIMMLEDDGLNKEQLLYAHVDTWVASYLFSDDGASCTLFALNADSWPINNDLASFAMWIFWFVFRSGALARAKGMDKWPFLRRFSDDYLTIDQSTLRVIVTVLKTFATGGHQVRVYLRFIIALQYLKGPFAVSYRSHGSFSRCATARSSKRDTLLWRISAIISSFISTSRNLTILCSCSASCAAPVDRTRRLTSSSFRNDIQEPGMGQRMEPIRRICRSLAVCGPGFWGVSSWKHNRHLGGHVHCK
jgi:hypothetical protein